MALRTMSAAVSIAALALSAGVPASGAMAAENAENGMAEGRAVINFADLPQRIDNWQADGTDGIYLEAGNDWYHGTFMAPCQGLPYSTTIGIVTDGLNQVDKFSSIVVESGVGAERCWFKSFEKAEGPPQDDNS